MPRSISTTSSILSAAISSSRRKGWVLTIVRRRTCGARSCGPHGFSNKRRCPKMLLRLTIALSILLLPASARTQTAQKPIQIIVPFAPGASADGIGRILAAELTLRLGRQVVVENKAGAGGTLGLVLVAKSPPDGDTLAIAATGALVINPHISNASPADSLRDL